MAKSKGVAFRGGLSELMKQAHRMQEKLERVKEELKAQTWTAEAAGGKIKVTINGAKEILSVVVDKEIVNPDELETLQDVLVSAVNAAIKLADDQINAATEAVTGNVRIPGMM
jgi:nucleoid-associated protein EbfC